MAKKVFSCGICFLGSRGMKYFIATLSNSSLPLLHNGQTHNLILKRTRNNQNIDQHQSKEEFSIFFPRSHLFLFYILFRVHVSLFRVLFQTLVRGKHKSVFLATQNKFWLLLSGQVDGITFLLNSETSRSCHGHVCYSLFA